MFKNIWNWIRRIFVSQVEPLIIDFIKAYIKDYITKMIVNKSITAPPVNKQLLVNELKDAVIAKYGSCSPETILEIVKQVESQIK
jgi:tRNA-dihydrouridine synthase